MREPENNVLRYDINRDIAEYNNEDAGTLYFEALGSITFCVVDGGELSYFYLRAAEDVPAYIEDKYKAEYLHHITEHKYRKHISYMMDGHEFIEAVDKWCFTDYDGRIGDIYVDGFISNLGLVHNGICQGGFVVDKKTFEGICTNHHVLVDWVNK